MSWIHYLFSIQPPIALRLKAVENFKTLKKRINGARK
jgi:hypothetical protein